MRTASLTLVAALLVSSVAFARPGGKTRSGPPPSAEQREQVMNKVHTLAVVELGGILGLDSKGTIQLSERLAPFQTQRVKLRLENANALRQLREAATTGAAGTDAAGLARRLAANRIALAQIDQQELEEVLKGLPADKAAEAAVFLAQFPRRVDRMARDIHEGNEGRPANRRAMDRRQQR